MDTDVGIGGEPGGATGASLTILGKPARVKRGTWVTFLNGGPTASTTLTYENRDELMRVRTTIVTSAARLGIPIKTKSSGLVLTVRHQTPAEVLAKKAKNGVTE